MPARLATRPPGLEQEFEAAVREWVHRQRAQMPAWGTPMFWARLQGGIGEPPTLEFLAALLGEARQREDREAQQALFTLLLARIDGRLRRWAAGVAAQTAGLGELSAYAVREDLCQELALRLWQRVALQPSEPWTVFFRRALDYEQRHVAGAYMRRNGYWPSANRADTPWNAARPLSLDREATIMAESPLLTTEANFSSAELADLADQVGRLPARERIAVLLRFWQQANEREIASALGVTPRTVRNLLRRAFTRLRATYGSEEDTP